MAAPALVALAHGSRDPRSAATIKALVAEVKAMRPDLRVETAFLDLAKPSFDTVVDRLVKAGFDEIVVVPLLLTEAYHAKVDVPEVSRSGTTTISSKPALTRRSTTVSNDGLARSRNAVSTRRSGRMALTSATSDLIVAAERGSRLPWARATRAGAAISGASDRA